MPFVEFNSKQLSDLVVHEQDPSVGYARQDLNVTPPAGGAAIAMGTVVLRAKAATNTPATAYSVLDASSDLSVDNEFAVVYGNHYSCQESFVPRSIANGQFNAVGFVGKNGGLILKDKLVREVAMDSEGAALTETQFQQLRELLASQGIILEVTI